MTRSSMENAKLKCCILTVLASVFLVNARPVLAQPTPRSNQESRVVSPPPIDPSTIAGRIAQPSSGIVGELSSLRVRRQEAEHEQITNKEEYLRDIRLACVKVYDPELKTPASCFTGHESTRALKLVTADCDVEGRFRVPLPAGEYFVEAGGWKGLLRVSSGSWTQVPVSGGMPGFCGSDGDCPTGSKCKDVDPGTRSCSVQLPSSAQPYNSGVTGEVGGPLWRGATQAQPMYLVCAKAYRPASSVPEACGVCSSMSRRYAIPLSPGKYVVELPGVAPRTIERMFVEVVPGEWTRIDAPEAGGLSVEWPYVDGRGD